MTTPWNGQQTTVRPKASNKTPRLLCLLVFGLTATVVYQRGHSAWTAAKPQPTYTATVCVVQRAATPADGQPNSTSSEMDKGETRTPIAHTEATPDQAVEAANTQAAQHVSRCRKQWANRVEDAYTTAHQATENARQSHAEATAQLAAFRRQLDEAAQAASEAKARAKAHVKAAPEPAMVENPKWLELQEKLAVLRRREERLLVTRTPLHPAVQDVASNIAGLEAELAGVSSRIPTEPKTEPNARELPAREQLADADAKETSVAVSIGAQDQERLNSLTAEVERTGRARDDADRAEEVALQEQRAEPTFVVEPPQVVENPPPPVFGWHRLLATTFAAGLVMAIGFGTFTTGAAIEPPVANVAQLEADLDMPLLGAVPAANPIMDAAAVCRRETCARRTLIALGLILMCACPLLAIWGLGGM